MNRYLSDPDRHPMAPGSPKILLVDDQDHNLIALEGLLAGRGWTLLTARSGAEALVQLQRHDDVAAIVLDLRMPGMDGFETAARIRAGERTRPTPIIFVTAAEEAGDRERAFRFAAADFVRKPFNALELPAKVGLFVELYQRSELRYRTLFEAMDEGYCLIEMLFDDRGEPHDYRFLEANPAFELQTGLVDAVGKTVRDMAPGHETHWFRIYGDVARTGRPTRFVQEARQLGRWYDVYAVRMGADSSDRVAVLFKDITEDKRVQDELRRLSEQLAAQDRTKNEFIATLAHELRAPLAPLRSALEVMKRSPGDAGRIERMREMMERQLTHLVHLVDDLLDIGRVANGKLQVRREPVDVAGIISRAVEATQPLIHERGHGLDLSLPRTPLIVSADRTRMAQVIGNLLTNAAKYTPPGGHLRLRVTDGGTHVEIAVTDDGIGLAAPALTQVFEMFKQVAGDLAGESGLGIGLSLVRRLVELHDGEVTASSPGLGLGSTFRVRLPLIGREAPPAVPDSQAAARAPGRLRVLVVDDNVDAADTLSMLLQMEGHTTVVAHDGDSALEAFERARPDLVFLDIGLPGRSGHEVARAIRARPGGDRPVLVALTGWGTEEDKARSHEAGFDHHLTKPADPSAVAALLAGAAAGR